jgi:hypothetical protein
LTSILGCTETQNIGTYIQPCILRLLVVSRFSEETESSFSDSETSESEADGSQSLRHTIVLAGHILPIEGESKLCKFPIISKEAVRCSAVLELPIVYINADDVDSMAVLAVDTVHHVGDYVVIDHLKW